MAMSTRKQAIAMVLSLTIGFAAVGYVFVWPILVAASQEEQERIQSQVILRQASTPQERLEAVTDLGMVFEYESGEWLMIRYRDSHGMPGWSMATALDSRGRWWRSETHFCGAMVLLGQGVEKMDSDDEAEREEGQRIFETFPNFAAIHQAGSLADVDAPLKQLGFKSFEPDDS